MPDSCAGAELVEDDGDTVKYNNIMITWNASKGGKEEHLTVYVECPEGTITQDVKPVIDEDGMGISINWKKNNFLLDPRLVVWASQDTTTGEYLCDMTHRKVAAFQRAVEQERGDSEGNKVWKEQRLTLPFECKQKFVEAGYKVIAPIGIVPLGPKQPCILILELVRRKVGYKKTEVEEAAVTVDFNTASTGSSCLFVDKLSSIFEEIVHTANK